MNWGNKAIERALNLAMPTDTASNNTTFGRGYIYINETVATSDKIIVNFTLDIPNKVIYLSAPVMFPVNVGVTVVKLEIESYNGTTFIDNYKINLEGDEIKEFPNGGALIVESLRINFNFE